MGFNLIERIFFATILAEITADRTMKLIDSVTASVGMQAIDVLGQYGDWMMVLFLISQS
jgi:hypothetical protein